MGRKLDTASIREGKVALDDGAGLAHDGAGVAFAGEHAGGGVNEKLNGLLGGFVGDGDGGDVFAFELFASKRLQPISFR